MQIQEKQHQNERDYQVYFPEGVGLGTVCKNSHDVTLKWLGCEGHYNKDTALDDQEEEE